jgi:hypothetical protein
MDPKKQDVKADPHSTSIFTRLMSMFGLTYHPVSAERMHEGDAGWAQEQEARQEWFNKQFNMSNDRKERHKIYKEMDTFPLVQSMLDVYAEEATQPDFDRGRRVWIEGPTHMIDAADECLRNVSADDEVTWITRRVCKYGDAFQRLIYTAGSGVIGWKASASDKVFRVDDSFGRLVGFREDGKKFRQKDRQVSWPWDYVHFRLQGAREQGERESGLHGTSLLDSVFRPWRQMVLVEDSLLLFRLQRAPDRNVFYIDVGNLEEHEAMDYVNEWRKAMRKHEFIDPASSRYKKEFNPLLPVEDIFLPMRGNTTSRIESLSGSPNVEAIYDLEHYVRSFFGAARIPKAYMGYEGEINAKATLQQQDVRFARTCKRVQRVSIYGLRQLLDIHFKLLQVDDATIKKYDFETKENDYKVMMSPIAYLDEWERLELVQLRYQVVEGMSRLAMDLQLNPRAWALYILKTYAKIPEDLIGKLIQKTAQSPAQPGMAAPPGGGAPAPFEWVEHIVEDKRTGKKDLVYRAEFRPEIIENMDPKEGYYDLSMKEERLIAEAVHRSPMLRKVIGDWAEYAQEELAFTQQSDTTLWPPTRGGVAVDLEADTPDVKELHEDLENLRASAGAGRSKED